MEGDLCVCMYGYIWVLCLVNGIGEGSRVVRGRGYVEVGVMRWG